MTTHEVAEASSPLTHLERESEVVSAPAEPAASLVFFPRPPWVPWDGVGWRQERGAAARLGRPLLLLLTTTTPELSIILTHIASSRAHG